MVEAKKLTIGPEGVLTQAERYSRGIRQQPRYQGEYGVPFLYSTNGERIRFHDVRSELQPLPLGVAASIRRTRSARLLERDFDAELVDAARRLRRTLGLRPYQVEANQAIEEAIAEASARMLVTMATGTGKTLMTVNEIYRLMKSRRRAASAVPCRPPRPRGPDRAGVRLATRPSRA